jgi:hypothetical protein
MVPITPDQLYEFAYQAGLRGQESMTCPSSYRGYVIPEIFSSGEIPQKLWRVAYAEGLEQYGAYMVQGEEDRERDWQD